MDKEYNYTGESILQPIYDKLLEYICTHCKGIVYEYGLHGECKCVRCERVYTKEEMKDESRIPKI